VGRYSIFFRKSVARDVRRIPKQDLQRILSAIDRLSEDPRPPNSEKLSGLQRYRLRQGVYRIIYEVSDDRVIVVVVKIGHRKEIYRRPQD
jgi:mRNA interferase RelE/StbE